MRQEGKCSLTLLALRYCINIPTLPDLPKLNISQDFAKSDILGFWQDARNRYAAACLIATSQVFSTVNSPCCFQFS